jgi:hypothetical protein
MAEIRTVTTLIAKRDEIERSIANYEARLEQARADLSHVNACIAIFEACDEPGGTRAYDVDLHRLFTRGEMMRLCKEALASGPKTTKELALIVIASKGFDTGDKVLARAMATRMIHALRQKWRRGHIDGEGKVRGARVWAIKPFWRKTELMIAVDAPRVWSRATFHRRSVRLECRCRLQEPAHAQCREEEVVTQRVEVVAEEGRPEGDRPEEEGRPAPPAPPLPP